MLLIDVTGKDKQAAELLEKVAANMTCQRSHARPVETVKGVSVTTYTLPKKTRRDGRPARRSTSSARTSSVACRPRSHQPEGILGRFAGHRPTDSLASLPAFKRRWPRCRDKAPDVAAAAERVVRGAFGYIQASRAAAGGRQKRGTDMVKVLGQAGLHGRPRGRRPRGLRRRTARSCSTRRSSTPRREQGWRPSTSWPCG